MSGLTISHQGNGVFLVSGTLTFATIDHKTIKLISCANHSKEVVLDLQAVSSADSAGLALMIEWIKYAREQRLSLSFKNVPQQLLTLAKLSGLENSPYFAKVCWPDSNQT